MDYDLVVRGGTVLDGSGGDPIEADVGIIDGRIAGVGRDIGKGREEVDARGKIVTPGFVDVHTHYDGQVTWENRLAPSSSHGVTTVVMGNCGVGFAPARPGDHNLMVKLMEGVEDIPEVVMTTGVPWNWESYPDYLDAIEKRKCDIDFASLLPHSPLRVYVMGERGASMEPPTENDLAQMRRLTAEAMRAGAIGVSTSRTWAHQFRDGRPAPSVKTADDEALALAHGLRDAGEGVFQLVNNTDLSAQDQFELYRKLATASGRPLTFSMLRMEGDEGWRYTLDQLKAANEEGLSITAQVIPRPTGGLLGLELSLHPFALNPSFRPLEKLPLAEKVRAMRDPELRARLLAESPEDPMRFFVAIVSDMEALFPLGDPPNYNPSPDDSIAAQARREGRDPREVIYDALLERDGRAILYRPMGNTAGHKFEGAGRDLLTEPHTVIGLGDGGAHYSMICDAALPTYFLTYWVRDASPDRAFSLPQAVRMLTHDTARTMCLGDRGLLKRGYKADVNVIDVDKLVLHAPHATYDLPAGGRRLEQNAEGYCATIVSGAVTYRNGEATGNLPGRLVRGGQPAPVAA